MPGAAARTNNDHIQINVEGVQMSGSTFDAIVNACEEVVRTNHTTRVTDAGGGSQQERPRRKMSAAARTRIAAAQRKRHAEAKRAKAKVLTANA